jgi:hypothetical protein
VEDTSKFSDKDKGVWLAFEPEHFDIIEKAVGEAKEILKKG